MISTREYMALASGATAVAIADLAGKVTAAAITASTARAIKIFFIRSNPPNSE
jgi:hypothetical protein